MRTLTIPHPAGSSRENKAEDYEQYLVGEISYGELMRREGRLITEGALGRLVRLLSLGMRLPGRS
jgi:hypothetical protein